MSTIYDPFHSPLSEDLTPEEIQHHVKVLYGVHTWGLAIVGIGVLGWLAWRQSQDYQPMRVHVPESVLAPAAPRKRRAPAKKKPKSSRKK